MLCANKQAELVDYYKKHPEEDPSRQTPPVDGENGNKKLKVEAGAQ